VEEKDWKDIQSLASRSILTRHFGVAKHQGRRKKNQKMQIGRFKRMKISTRKIFLLLAIVLSLTTVQSVLATSCNVAVSGDVTAMNYEENAITIGETIVYGIPFAYLANKLGIEVNIGDYVNVTAFQCPSTGVISACTLSVDTSDVIYLPGARSR
jgi:hypothetical protein